MLTPTEQAKIEAEEKYRFSVREQLEREKAMPVPKTPAEIAEEEKKKDGDAITAYRDNLYGDLAETEKDFHTTLTYVTAGALGLFLTINEKVFHLEGAAHTVLLWVSVAALIISLLLFIVTTMKEMNSSEKLMIAAGEMIEKKEYDRKALRETWKQEWKKFAPWFYIRFWLLIIGIAAESAFIVCNLNAPTKKEDNTTTLKIEGLAPQSNLSIEVDTTKLKTKINIK